MQTSSSRAAPVMLLLAGALLGTLLVGCAPRRVELAGFVRSPYFDEQVRTFTFDPDVTVHLNAPPAADFDPRRPTLLAVFALPNGNTIAQTIGCRAEPGLDWHFQIQHIGAQTRRLREVCAGRNLVVAYVEAGGRSWPAWRRTHADAGQHIVALVDALRQTLPDRDAPVALAAHSGGGSLLFGYLDAVAHVPDWIERIVWLDANYAYSDEQGHAEKLIEWLQRSPQHRLGIVAYDDRAIEVDGRKVVGPTGGTYRKTQATAARLGMLYPLAAEERHDRTVWRSPDGQVDIQLFKNPDNRILHTVLVERNGFLHALTFGTPQAARAGALFDAPAYEAWIQSGRALPN